YPGQSWRSGDRPGEQTPLPGRRQRSEEHHFRSRSRYCARRLPRRVGTGRGGRHHRRPTGRDSPDTPGRGGGGVMDRLFRRVREASTLQVSGKITKIVGLVVEGFCPQATVGTLCELIPSAGGVPVPAEVVGFRDG